MIYLEDYNYQTYIDLLTNINNYDMIYIAAPDKQNGEIYILDSFKLYYINDSYIQFEIVMDLLSNNIRDGLISSIAVVNAQHLKQKNIRLFRELDIDVDFYAALYDISTNMYSTSKYLYSLKMKEEQINDKQ